MGQLIIVVLAIALTSLVVVGGISYLHSDTGVRLETYTTVSAQYQTLDAAMRAYRIANRGALPVAPALADAAGDTSWLTSIMAYLPVGGLQTPANMQWLYATDGSRILCLTTSAGRTITRGTYDGLVQVASKVNGAIVGKSCGSEDHTTFDGTTAITFPLETAG